MSANLSLPLSDALLDAIADRIAERLKPEPAAPFAEKEATDGRLLLAKPEAAATLGMSVDSFERYVQAEIRVVRRGRLRLFPLAELQRWAEDNAAQPLVGRG